MTSTVDREMIGPGEGWRGVHECGGWACKAKWAVAVARQAACYPAELAVLCFSLPTFPCSPSSGLALPPASFLRRAVKEAVDEWRDLESVPLHFGLARCVGQENCVGRDHLQGPGTGTGRAGLTQPGGPCSSLSLESCRL